MTLDRRTAAQAAAFAALALAAPRRAEAAPATVLPPPKPGQHQTLF